MAANASIVELLLRGDPGERARIRHQSEAENTARLAQAQASEAAAREHDALTEKHQLEADAFRQAQADNQVRSDAFVHVGGNPNLMDKYIRANASAHGYEAWRMDDAKYREQTAKTSKEEFEHTLKVHKAMAESAAYLDGLPDADLQPQYDQWRTSVQKLDPTIQLPEKIDRMGLKRINGMLNYVGENLAAQKEQSTIAETQGRTATAAQKALEEQRAAFAAAVSADPTTEGLARATELYPTVAAKFPKAPGGWMAAVGRGTVPVKDRVRMDQDSLTLAGTDVRGITALDQEKLALEKGKEDEAARHNKTTEGLTSRGQDMTDSRARELADIARNSNKMEASAVKDVGELQNGINQIEVLRDAIKKGHGKMGPIAGLANAPVLGHLATAMGYTDPAKLKAKLDLVKQSIGKALEGGVLRKEDEAKYMAILPNMYDPLDVAYSKIEMLESKLRSDMKTALATNAAAGRRVPDMPGAHDMKPSSPGSGHSGDENIEKLKKQFPGATITRVP